MREGRFFTLPDGPADAELLWQSAPPITAESLPPWLAPEDAHLYRCHRTIFSGRDAQGLRETYQREMDELIQIGFILEPADGRSSSHRLYQPVPDADSFWSIGIMVGSSPFQLQQPAAVTNPILTAADITDRSAAFVADPFLSRSNGRWQMFFEVFNWRHNKGEIGLALSDDGLRWSYQGIVLAEPFHLSYPCVFEDGGAYFMTPESYQAGEIRLYRARRFPFDWEPVATLIEGAYLVDPTPFIFNRRWRMFADTGQGPTHDTLRLYSADRLTGPWREHPRSPIVSGDPTSARPAGRVITADGHLYRLAQDCVPSYGTAVRAFEITELSEREYHERPVKQQPVLEPSGHGWNALGMHHLDARRTGGGQWLAAVDGRAQRAPG